MMLFALISQIICGLPTNLLNIQVHELLLDEIFLPGFLLLKLGPYTVSLSAIFIMLD